MKSKMDRWEALYDFWSSFGLPAYEENSVPENAEMPYITYEASVGGFENEMPLSASIWDRTKKGSAFIDSKADEIEQFIKDMGCPSIKGGRYRVYASETQPFAQSMGDPEDRLIKRRILNVVFEFMTV